MLSKLSNLQGVKVLSKTEQRDLKGGTCQVCNYTCCTRGTEGCFDPPCYWGSCYCKNP
jgi:hypothetical protein